jgi:hypothetical protein
MGWMWLQPVRESGHLKTIPIIFSIRIQGQEKGKMHVVIFMLKGKK